MPVTLLFAVTGLTLRPRIQGWTGQHDIKGADNTLGRNTPPEHVRPQEKLGIIVKVLSLVFESPQLKEMDYFVQECRRLSWGEVIHKHPHIYRWGVGCCFWG